MGSVSALEQRVGEVWLQPATVHQQGDWVWQLRGDEVADVSYRGRRLLRSVRAVSRDSDWGTRELSVRRVEQTASGVRIDVTVHDDLGDGDSAALLHGTVVVDAAGDRLSITAELHADAEVWTNRTGLVVLHPPQLAGTPVRVTHPDGTVEAAEFPRAISPHQPALDIAGLEWTSHRFGSALDGDGDGGLGVTVRFDGDAFEMEDQRNWTDASFKTYSRPLSLPFPYRVPAGGSVRQQVEVTARPPRAAAGAVPAEDAAPGRSGDDLVRLAPAGAFPEVALGASTAPDPAPTDVQPLGAAVLVELELATPWWRAALARARSSGARLDVRVVLDHRREQHLVALRTLARELVDLDVVRVAAFDAATHVTDGPTAAALRAALQEAGTDVPVVGGARSHFTELNREQSGLPADLAGVVFSLTPLFHATGTEQLVESVAVQRTVARQAVAIAAGRPVHIGPITLRPRFNDVATTPPRGEGEPARAGLPAGYGAQLHGQDDPRQGAAQLAAWTIASAAALAVPGVASLTCFEQWGPRGICTRDGQDLPVAAALRALDALRGGERLVGDSPDGLVWALGASTARATTVLAANLDTRPRTLSVQTPRGTVTTDLAPGAWTTTDLLRETSWCRGGVPAVVRR